MSYQDTLTRADTAADAAFGLPVWPLLPEDVDPAAATYLVVALGADPRTGAVAGEWVRLGEARVPTRLVVADDVETGWTDLAAALGAARTGVRIMVVGGHHDVLRTLALAREFGAGPAELRSFVVDPVGVTDLPVYCAHCRATRRMRGEPGGETLCPGCARTLAIHGHHSAARGSYLASDATVVAEA